MQIEYEGLIPIEKNEEPVMSPKQRATEPFNAASLFEKEIDKRTFITQTPGIEVFLEKTEVTPYIINGKPEGLCITGLDDSSMAGYFGFESGDAIQTINEQTLTDKQKAFQILKKARSQSSLNFQLLRNEHKMNLVFETK